jgi:hypothetical protein
MTTKITRQEFLAMLVPSWVTKRNIIRSFVIVVITCIFASIISIINSLGVLTSLKIAGVILGVLAILLLISSISNWVKSRLILAPAIIQAIASAILDIIVIATISAVAISCYEKWKSGEDLTVKIYTFIFIFVMYVVHKRNSIIMANKSASADGGASAPSPR